jgi:uncharacterized membrane protein (UPF0182 family)
MTSRRWLMVVLGAAAVLLIAGRALAGAYADYLWYESLGAVALWRLRAKQTMLLELGSALGAGLFAFANLYAVRQSVVQLVFPRRVGDIEIGEEVSGRYLIGATVGLSALLGVVLTLPQDSWTTFFLARAGRPFQETDPYFSTDLGFFVYWLPFENLLWNWAFIAVIVVAAAVVLLYALTPSLKWERRRFEASGYVKRHLTVLAGVILLMAAWSFRLDMYSLLAGGTGAEAAFSYVDHRVGIPGDLLLSVATLGAGLIVLWAGFAGQFRLAGIATLSVIVLALVVREAAPLIAEHSGSDSERTLRELPYVATRAAYTRRAFGVANIPSADSSVAYPSLTAAMPWVPIWDPSALARAIDAGRTGDDQTSLTGWRVVPSEIVADIVGAPPPGASARAPWTVARIRAAEADERGAPVRLNGPNATATDDIPLEAPIVFPGARTPAVVADSLTRTTGTPLASFATRLATAWSMQDFHLLGGDLAQPKPTLIAHRDVRERVARCAPFFAVGGRVQPLLHEDTLYWGVDLYSASETYPLSWHLLAMGQERGYLRHAAVAVVQAATGEVTIVPDSTLDPIADTWVRVLPGLFGTWTGLPQGLRTLFAPPADGLYAQAAAFGRYGRTTDNDPPRHVPILMGADTLAGGDDLPLVLPGSNVAALTLPLLDEQDRLRGLLIGSGGATGRLAWYRLPALGPRWSGVLDRLRSLDSAGSAAREGPLAHGRVRAVPVRAGVAFIQPTYRWRAQSVPSINRLALLSGDTTRSVVPPFTTGNHAASPSTVAEPKASAAALYNAMRDALRRGDWTAFGRAFEALGRLLGQPPKP